MKQNLLQSLFTTRTKDATANKKISFLSLLLLAGIMLFSVPSMAQTYYQVTHATGTAMYAGVTVTATPTGGAIASNFCGGNVDPYRMGSTGSTYTFTFSTAVAHVRIASQFGPGSFSTISYSINGSPFPITSANVIGAATSGCSFGGTCTASGGVLTNSVNTGGQPSALVQIDGTINSLTVTFNGPNQEFAGILFSPIIAFNNGSPQTQTLCQNSSAASINSLLTASGLTGNTFTWSVITAPTNGTLGGFSSNPTASSGVNISPTGTTYTPTTGYSGPDSYTIQVSDGTYSTTTTVNVNVIGFPASITGSSIICGTGNTTTLSDAVTGGTWTSGTTTVATVNSSTGVVTSVATGTSIITYTTGCGSDATQTVTVGAFPAAISGTANACPGTTATLTDATAFGAWTSSAPGVATVGSSTGVVTGVAAGTTTISYTLNTGCAVGKTFTVNATPAAITGGGGLLCVTNTMTLSDATSGGAWSSSNAGVASVSGGTVTGVSGGTATITYTSASGCISTLAVSVTALPVVSGGSNVAICAGTGTTLTGSGAVIYTWSPATGLSSTAGTSVTATPTVTTTYTVTGSNGTANTNTFNYTGSIVSYTVPAGVTTMNIAASGAQGGDQFSSPASGGLGANMSGVFTVTPGNVLNILVGQKPTVAQLTGGGGGGSFVWDVTAGNTLLIAAGGGGGAGYNGSPNTGIDAVTTNNGTNGGGGFGGAGVSGNGGTVPGSSSAYGGGGAGWLSGGAAGNDFGSCGGNAGGGVTPLLGGAGGAGKPTTSVNSNGGYGGGGGAQGYCGWAGGGGGGGYSGGAGGYYTGTALPGGGGGSYNIGTSQSNTVGNTGNGAVTISYLVPGCQNTATVTVTVNPLPSAISGASSVCATATTTLTDATAFGAWTSSNTTVATIGSATGVASGVAAGSTTITYTLPTGCRATTALTVNPLPVAISGTGVVCVGLTATLSNGTTGGAWTSSNTSLATIVSGTGLMTGVLAGNPIITYTTASGCIATTVATVNPLPAAITGNNNVCVGLTTALTDVTAGGTWTTSTSSVATVGSSTGIVSGVAAGTTTITYTLSTGCINTYAVTVNPNPVSISGTPVVCAGLTTTLTDGTAGGNWSSSNLTVASIGTTSGIMTGFVAGTTTITYMLPTSCIAIVTGTVNTLPAAISGTTNVCAGLTTGLSDALTGGTWTTSVSSVATVGSSSGLVSGVAAGTTTITYKLPTGCINTVVVTVNPLPANIAGTQVVCEAATTTLSDATGFGAWSTANTTATINSVSGVVTGVAAGTATVTYTLTTGCIATAIVTINPTPAITAGTGIVCVGLTTTLTGSGFGNWSSSNTAVATVGSGTGIVTGVTAGYPNISYTLITGCYAMKVATVNPLPTAFIGTMSSCIGATSALSDATTGGAWTTSVSSVATVGSSSGIVSGVAAGTTTISYTLSATGCAMTGVFTVNPFPSAITGTTNTCPGATTALADASTFGNWSSSNTAVATVGSGTGIVSGIAAGTTTITYTLSTGCSTTTALTVNPLPSAITGTQTVCAGLNTSLTDAGGGTWASSNLSAATVISSTGVVTGVAAGTTTITYTLATGCQSMATVTVYALPAPVSGTLNVCAGLTTGLSDATGTGTWTSSTSSVATIGSTTGLVNGLVAGTSTITYMIPTGCISTAAVTVNPLPAAITGTTNVCVGLTTPLSDATLPGAWSSSITSVATVVSGSGVVTGVLAGTTTITYTLGTGCIMTTQLTVNPLPAAITGSSTVCAGLTTSFSDGSAGGAWTSGNTSAATVNSLTGAVFGVAAGTSTITYTLTTGCINTKVITVNPLPASISGIMSVCTGLTTTLSDATGTGTWSSSDPTLAPVGATTGVVGGLAVGTPTITYMLGTGCIATTIVTVNPLPAAITGTMNVCVGLFTILSDATPSGVWSSSNTTVAPVAGGIVIGGTAGTATITYTLPTGCINTTVVTVNPLPAAIGGTTNVCVGNTTALTDASPFGTWSSSNSTVATVVAPTGVVSGLFAGTTTITYTLNTGCLITTPVTVNALPSSITGTFTVCAGLTTALTDAGGGTWTSGNTTVATVNGTGLVSGLVAGTASITYTLPTGCTSISSITVNPLPAGITGPNAVCNGLGINMSDATVGGTWSSSNTTVASISSLTGGLTGNAAGTATITYALTATGCINTTSVTVNPLPLAITGTTNVCIGLTTTLSDATPSGTWASSNLTVATIGTSSGTVTGFTAGTATVTYKLTTTGCIMTTPVTVNPLPSAVTGTMNVCAGLSTQLTDAGGGTWSSSNTTVATVNGSGLVNGLVAGTTTITYTLPTGCITTTNVLVNPLPSSIGGLNNVCFGLTTSLNDPTPFGLWSSSNTAVATIGSGTGLVSGLTVGSTTITYQLATGCISTLAFTVNPLPTSILGNGAVCLGLTTALSDASPLGTWSSSNTTVATIGTTSGIMSGMAVGTTTITYTLPTTCMITMTGTVNPLPAAITGATTHVCQGLSITMSDATTPGTWSSSNTGIATVNSSTGVVNGIAPGTMTLTYTLPTSCIMTATITVDPLPATITGTMSVCAGLTTTLSDATPSGTWSSSNTAVATAAANVVTGVVAGTSTITYTLPTGCIMTSVVTVNPLPATITGTANVCAGLTTTLSDATALGTWSSSNTTVATIGTGTGLVNGLVAGTSTVTYKLTATGCIMTTTLTVNPLPATITGTKNVCAGLTTALSDITPSGVWSSSNTSVATVGSTTGVVGGVVAGTSTITYTLTATGCIMTASVLVNPLPAAITGTMSVCAGLTTTLSDATPSGTWSSSNTAIATVAGNVVTGVLAGTATVTYTLPATGCIMTTVITVNPLPQPIGGTLNVCVGLTSALTDATTGGTFSNDMSLLITPLTITPGGIMTGLTAGTNMITYTLFGTGCIATAVATVNPLPIGIIGNTHVCAGLTTPMSDATLGGNWSSSNTAVATITGTVVTGVVAGTSTITYKLPTGCIMTKVITVDPLPTTISGTLDVCAGLTTALSNGSTGGMWSVGTTSVATVNSTTGVVTGVMAGTTTVTYTLSTGCIMTDMVTVNPLPDAITGTTQVCKGLTTPLGTTSLGGSWSSGNTAIATVDATLGEVTGVAAGTVQITYTLPTGCIMTTMVTVNPLPSAITGTMNVCAGSMTTLTDAGGGSWTSGDMSVATVSGSVVTGVMYGTSTITYTLPTGCITTAVATVDSLPTVFAVTGGGSYCPLGLGVHVLLSGSVSTFTYQLYVNGIPLGGSPTIGTGLALDFGTETATGVYTVVAKDPLTSCTSNMASTATVSLYPLPAPHTVSGGGSYCAGDTGVHVGLTFADGTVKYQLYVGGVATGSTITGSNAPLDFGLKTVADTYTVVGTDLVTTCSSMMTGKATVKINALLTPSVTVSYPFHDTICAGTPITFTATPVNGGTAPTYTWQVNGKNKGTTNSFTYVPANADVVAAILKSNAVCPSPDTAIGSVTMPIIPISSPKVTISSDHGDTVCGGNLITYTATPKFGGSAQKMTWVLNGLAVDSGATYSYIPKQGDIIYNTLFSNYRCRDTNRVFSNNIFMTVDSVIIPTVTVVADPGASIATGTKVTFTAMPVDGGDAPKFQWYVNQVAVSGATTNVFTKSNINNLDSVSVMIQRTDACGKATFNGIKMHVGGVSVLQVSATASDINVLPNPNKGEFVVKGSLGVSEDVAVTLELTNMLGQVVYKNNVTAQGGNLETQVKISNTLANGMYLLNVRSESASKVFHVVIEQ